MKLLKLILLTLFLCLPSTCSFLPTNVYFKLLRRKITNVIEQVVPKNECSMHLKAWIADFLSFDKENLWALQMFDASAKVQSGFLSGNIFNFGDFDECLGVRISKAQWGLIEGQYCTVFITRSKNSTEYLGQLLDFGNTISELMNIREGSELKQILRLFRMSHGICLPKSCSAESIQKLWNYVEHSLRLPVHFTIDDDFCSFKGKAPDVFLFDRYILWGFALYFFVLFLATLISHGYDAAADKSFVEELVSSFSLTKNISKLLNTAQHNEDRFTCVRGLKTISMLWVIFGHIYSISFVIGSSNMLDHFEWRKSWPALFILMANYAVDTFFVISGLLLAYKYFQLRHLLPKNNIFIVIIFYSGRLVRLWPGLIAAILLKVSVLKYMNDGPLWPVVMYISTKPCRYTGWISALFATNLLKFRYQCFQESWYLAIDGQLWCIAPIILYLLHKHSKSTVFGLTLLSAISMTYAYYVTVTYREKWSLSDGTESYQELLYQSTFVRMPCWIFGIITGTVLYRNPKIVLPHVMSSLMWIIALAGFLGVSMWHNHLNNHPYNEHTAGLFNALSRPVWGLSVCLVIVLCVSDYGGIVNNILSSNAHLVFVRMAYSTFLVHTAVILLLHGGKRNSTYHSLFITIRHYLADLPFILLASLVWCLAFESPYLNIIKLMIRRYTNDGKRSLMYHSDYVDVPSKVSARKMKSK